jgi:hypothetical protein
MEKFPYNDVVQICFFAPYSFSPLIYPQFLLRIDSQSPSHPSRSHYLLALRYQRAKGTLVDKPNAFHEISTEYTHSTRRLRPIPPHSRERGYKSERSLHNNLKAMKSAPCLPATWSFAGLIFHVIPIISSFREDSSE